MWHVLKHDGQDGLRMKNVQHTGVTFAGHMTCRLHAYRQILHWVETRKHRGPNNLGYKIILITESVCCLLVCHEHYLLVWDSPKEFVTEVGFIDKREVFWKMLSSNFLYKNLRNLKTWCLPWDKEGSKYGFINCEVEKVRRILEIASWTPNKFIPL